MSRAGRLFSLEVERTFRFASGESNSFGGLQPRHMPPAEAGFGNMNQRKDATLKGRFTGGMR